jgi:hypothetical protein
MKSKTMRVYLAGGIFAVAAAVGATAVGLGGGGGATTAAAAAEQNAYAMTVYKSPTCGCCGAWIEHMEEHGFTITVKEPRDLGAVKVEHGITRELGSCHTGVIAGYAIEGHVPAREVKRLLEERPQVSGLAVPGMPMGSPGMEGSYTDPYDVLTFDRAGRTTVFASYR